MTTFQQSDFIARALRIVVPMRREFGRSVNVQSLLDDPGYASEVLEMALSSNNERLRAEALYLQRMLGSPRQVSAAPAPAMAAVAEPDDAVDSERERLQALQAAKYRLGVR